MTEPFSSELAGDALNAFMDWWSSHPDLNFIEAKVGYFDLLLAETNRVAAERNEALRRAAASSTSAQLQQTQHELAHAQFELSTATARIAALTDDVRSVELERDGVREELARQAEANEDLTGTLAMRTGQLTTARRHVNAAHEAEDAALERAGRYRHERDLARAELASATAELEQLRAQLPTSLHTEEPPA